MAAYKKQRPQTELSEFIVRNVATVMEREREKRGMGKVEFAELCGIKAPSFLQILAGKANPTIDSITRISMALKVPVCELLYNDAGARVRASKTRSSD
jgi:ribosome-binding protein aMBF1 (putative translation factor)